MEGDPVQSQKSEVEAKHADRTVNASEATQSNDADYASGTFEASATSAELPVFEAKNVTFSYTGEKNNLDGVNLTVYSGEIIALVGENGSGKSTLAKVLLGTLPIDSGELSFCGVPYSELGEEVLSRNIGTFFQDSYLYHHSVAENIAYGCVELIDDAAAINHALEQGGATHIVEALPHGVQTMVRKRIDPEGVEFSGGEKQLLGTARAYMGDKDILIFDEPASMLDPLAELDQFARIRERARGRTAILISHRVGFARLADRIVVMDAGRVVESGTHDELLKQDGLYARLFNDQAQFYMDIDEAPGDTLTEGKKQSKDENQTEAKHVKEVK